MKKGHEHHKEVKHHLAKAKMHSEKAHEHAKHAHKAMFEMKSKHPDVKEDKMLVKKMVKKSCMK